LLGLRAVVRDAVSTGLPGVRVSECSRRLPGVVPGLAAGLVAEPPEQMFKNLSHKVAEPRLFRLYRPTSGGRPLLPAREQPYETARAA
jgi:hypothetical protein